LGAIWSGPERQKSAWPNRGVFRWPKK